MEGKINFEHAIYMVKMFLKELVNSDPEYLFTLRGIKLTTNMKININGILSNPTILERLTDIILFDNVLTILKAYNGPKIGKIVKFDRTFNLFLTFYKDIVGVSVGEGLVRKNETISAYSDFFEMNGEIPKGEALRKKLYDMAGYEFQSKKDGRTLDKEEIGDPLALDSLGVKFPNIDDFYGFLDNPNCILLIQKQYVTPRRINELKKGFSQ